MKINFLYQHRRKVNRTKSGRRPTLMCLGCPATFPLSQATISIFSGYRPVASNCQGNSAFAQHLRFFFSINKIRCPRSAFLEDLAVAIQSQEIRASSLEIKISSFSPRKVEPSLLSWVCERSSLVAISEVRQ